MPKFSKLDTILIKCREVLSTIERKLHPGKRKSYFAQTFSISRIDTAQKLLNELNEIKNANIPKNIKVTNKVLKENIKEGKPFTEPKPRKQYVRKPQEVKVLYKFVVNVLQTKVYPPVNEWMNMRYFEYGKQAGQWSNQNIQNTKIAEEDNIVDNKFIWKKGEKLVYVVQSSVTVEKNMMVTDGSNKPFVMTSRGIQVGFKKNLKQNVVKYNGNKPYEYDRFYFVRGIVRDDYSTTISNNYVKRLVNLPTFLDKIFNNMTQKTQSDNIEYIVVENFGIIKVNDGLESIGETSPIYMMMMNNVIVKDCWLRYANDISSKAFEPTNNICVYYQLANFLLNPTSGQPTKFIDKLHVSEEALYKFLLKRYPSLKMDEGVSTAMVDLIGKETKRNVYAYDFNDQCFFRSINSTGRNYCPIIFYRGNGHMYLINTKEAFKSVVERNKVNEPSIVNARKIDDDKESTTETIVKHIEGFDGITCSLGQCDQLESGVYLMNRFSICKDVVKFIAHYRIIPKVKTTKNAITSMLFLNSKNKKVVIACDVNYEHGGIVYQHLKNVATENKIDYVNEGIGAVVSRIVCKNKKQKREYLNEEQRLKLIESFHNKCAMCHLDSNKFEIDHIIPLCSGGSNEVTNLQPLCPNCHKEKSHSECENGDYEESDKQQESSSFNNNVFTNVISTESFKTWQFVERTNDTCTTDDTVKKIDMNKCRKNLLYYSKFEFPVFSVMDSVLPFNPNDSINVGFYYVETKNTFPFRGCGWYSHPLIIVGLRDQIIYRSNIKLKLESSRKLPNDHFQKNIDKLLEAFSSEPNLQKLCINTYIGLMGKTKYEKSKSQFTMCKYEAANLLCDHNTFILQHSTEKFNIYQSNQTQSFIMNSTMYPVYAQILQMEAMHLYETEKIVKMSGGIILDRNTDAIRYKEMQEIDITQYFWDDAKTVQKYKWEDPRQLMTEVNPKMERQPVEGLVEMFVLKWNIEYDYETDALTKATEIIEKKMSLHIDGRAGTGKSYLTNTIIKVLKQKGLTYTAFSPTNKGARIIDGVTIDSMYYTLKKNKSALNKFKKIDVIIIDEVSMMQERFYDLFINIKKTSPTTTFIITGDFDQLPPVKDSWVGDYKNSSGLFELCNGNRLQLTKNRRSDPRLFELARNVETVNIKDYPVTQLTYLNISYKHSTRIKVNQMCLEKFIEENLEPDDTSLVIPKDPDNPKTQDVELFKGVPVVCHTTRNNKEEKAKQNGFLNSERFKVIRVSNKEIVLHSDRIITISPHDFHKYFYIGFCITVHTSQGETFDEKYTIYDWNFFHFCDKAKYVAVSRATSIDNIQIHYNPYERYKNS
jgi:hypothetical protein